MPVQYTGTLPDIFKPGITVVVEGKLGGDGVFGARTCSRNARPAFDSAVRQMILGYLGAGALLASAHRRLRRASSLPAEQTSSGADLMRSRLRMPDQTRAAPRSRPHEGRQQRSRAEVAEDHLTYG